MTDAYRDQNRPQTRQLWPTNADKFGRRRGLAGVMRTLPSPPRMARIHDTAYPTLPDDVAQAKVDAAFTPALTDSVGPPGRVTVPQRQIARFPLQFGLPPRPVVYHLMAPVVGHFLPTPYFIEGTETSNAQSGLAIEGAHIDAG